MSPWIYIYVGLILIFKCTIKDTLKRAGLDPKEHWEHQPKDKLARIYWAVSSRRQLWSAHPTELTWKVKECQPYMACFAQNWPIEEYIKHHHKNVCAYWIMGPMPPFQTSILRSFLVEKGKGPLISMHTLMMLIWWCFDNGWKFISNVHISPCIPLDVETLHTFPVS